MAEQRQEMKEAEPTKPKRCDNCGLEYMYWLMYFDGLGVYICEECLTQAIVGRNSKRFRVSDED